MLGQAHAQMAVMDVGETAGGGRRGVGVKQSAFDAKMDRWLPVTATKPAAPATTDRAMTHRACQRGQRLSKFVRAVEGLTDQLRSGLELRAESLYFPKVFAVAIRKT